MSRAFVPFLLLASGLVLAAAGCSSSGAAAGGGDGGEDGSASSEGDGGSGSSSDDEEDGSEDGDGGSSSDDGTGSGSGSNDGSGGSTVNYVPAFPGAPSGEAGKPLVGGEICDEVPGATINAVSDVTRCFYGQEETMPSATIEQVLECVDGTQTIHLRLTFNPGFNDNTFGAGSIGWPEKRGHRFRDLTGSDHAELKLVDGDGEVAMQFKLDYIEEDPSAPSGYASQCAMGGDGNVSVGDAAHIVDCTTSLDENLNARGYGEYTTDSPLTDENYAVNQDAPEWDYRMVFEVWVDAAAFGDAGFSGAFIEYVHASPAKTPDDTIEVESKECPPCEPSPDYVCDDQNKPPTLEECIALPDDVCDETTYEPPTTLEECMVLPDYVCDPADYEPPPEEPPPYCELYPTDPGCLVF